MEMKDRRNTASYSRREFGQMVLIGLPLSLAMARIDSTIHGVRIGVQSYSFRTLSLEEAIRAMVDIGIGECELFSGHVEPRRQIGPPPQVGSRPRGGAGGAQPPQGRSGTAGRGPDPAAREELRNWRLTVPLDHFEAIRRKFDGAGVALQAYNLSFNDSFTDEEIDRGFQMAQALGVRLITASATVSSARRVAPFADRYGITVGMHNHANLSDPNQFAKPESFAQAMALSETIGVNLDIGHFVAAGYDPIAYIEAHHDRITNLHLKDRKKDGGPNVPWGEGDTPIREVLQLLKRHKYDIPANIEYEYPGEDAVAEVARCFQYCKDALA